MIDKQTFLDRLTAALIERGISQTDIQPYIERFDRFFDRMVMDERGGAQALEDIDNIADNIAAQVSERYDEINRLAERTMTVNRVQADDEPSDGSLVPLDDDEGTAPYSPVQAEPDEEPPAEMMESTRLPDYVEEEPSPNSTIFWVLFAISLPITLVIALAVIALFLLVWGGLATVIVGSIAVLIVIAAGGTALSLVGIIYGIIQLFSVVPVGLYEIGLGVIIAGVVMFAGILLYNFAVRLVPLLIRLVGRLFRYLYGRLKVLFNFLRRECAKL